MGCLLWIQILSCILHQSLQHMCSIMYDCMYSLIATFMGPTWGPSGADRTQVGPMLAPWTLLSGILCYKVITVPKCTHIFTIFILYTSLSPNAFCCTWGFELLSHVNLCSIRSWWTHLLVFHVGITKTKLMIILLKWVTFPCNQRVNTVMLKSYPIWDGGSPFSGTTQGITWHVNDQARSRINNVLAQDCCVSNMLAMEIPQSQA